MAHFNKVGLVILSSNETKFLLCVKNNFTSDFIIPGGQFEKNETDKDCLIREIKEELSTNTDEASLEYIGDYTDAAAGDPSKDVMIRLYKGKIIEEPIPSNEVIDLYWLSKDDLSHPRLSPIIRNKIMPDLIKRKILK